MQGRAVNNSIFGRAGMASILILVPLLVGCKQEAEAPPAAPRQVRTTVITERGGATAVNLTGRVEAEDEVPLAFRIGGRVLENGSKLGQRLQQAAAHFDALDTALGCCG